MNKCSFWYERDRFGGVLGLLSSAGAFFIGGRMTPPLLSGGFRRLVLLGSPGYPWDLVEVGVEAVYLLCPEFLHGEVGQGVVEAQP